MNIDIEKIEKVREKVVNFADDIKFLWTDEPLDGDETRDIAEMILGELDVRNGNLDARNTCEVCGRSTEFGSGLFVNRVPTLLDLVDTNKNDSGWLCRDCDEVIFRDSTSESELKQKGE